MEIKYRSVFIRLLHIIGVLTLVYVVFGAVLYINQRNLLYSPQIGSPNACDAFINSGVKKIIQNETTLYYKKNGGAIVVYYHGNGGTACDRKYLADIFDERGLSYLFVEYAGYADERETTKENIFQDVRNVDDFLRSIHFEQLIFLSESLGAGPLAYHTTLLTPQKVALITPYTSIGDILEYFPYSLYPISLLLKDNFDTHPLRDFYGKILVIHGTDDEVIPFSVGRAVYESIQSDKKDSLFVSGARHNTVLYSSGVMGGLLSFLQK